MKKVITIGIIAALLVIVSFLGWRHVTSFNDDEIRKNLTGKWVLPPDAMGSGSFTIRQDGSYIAKWPTPSGVTVTHEGTLQIENGYMVNSVTYSSVTNQLPHDFRNRIIRADAHKIVIDDGGNVEVVFRKVAE